MSSEYDAAIRALADERLKLLERLPCFESGLDWCRAHTEAADRVVQIVFERVCTLHPDGPPVALIATGGYGRRELAPYSDIDITLVPGDEGSPHLDAVVRDLFQNLHHAFGTVLRLDVSWAYRLLADMPGIDARTRTGLIDARLVAGSPAVYRAMADAFWDSFSVGDFLLEKVGERLAMHRKHHDTPLVVEPSLKEGAGGLRSFQCANWIRLAIGERGIAPTPAYDAVLRARNLLHMVSGRLSDMLTRGRQAEISDLLEIEMYAFSGGLARHMIELAREFEQGLERMREARFSLSNGVAAIRGEARVLPYADAGEAAVGIAIATRLGLGVADIPTVTRDEVSGPAAQYALSTGEPTLRNLDRSGLLEKLLPELAACRTLMPRDTVHVYTVFEHTMRAVRQLDSIIPGSFLGDLKETLHDESLLYLGTLLHDAGKLDEGRPHSESGADLARAVCMRWGLGAADTEFVVWLVREHLTMARFIRIRDLQNADTVREFAAVVGDMDRLGALTLLTWADINAVAPGAWTRAQESFLRELYSRTAEALQGEGPPTSDEGLHRQRIKRQLRQQEVPESEVEAFVQSLPAHYLSSAPPEQVRLHMRFVQRAQTGEPVVDFSHHADAGATEVTVCAPDSPGLLSRMLGVLYALDLSVAGIRAMTTRTERPVALDVFTASLGGRPLPEATCRQVASALLKVLRGETTVDALLRERNIDPDLRQRVFSYQYIEGNPGVLEVRSTRSRGVAYRLSRLIADQGWNIVTARVGQWAGQSAAAFYILDGDESPLSRTEVDRVFSVQSEPE